MLKTDKIDFVALWIDDKQSIIETMLKNMNADINAGYDPHGANIEKQRAAIREYVAAYNAELMKIADKTPQAAARFCKFDLIRRGAIEI